MLSSDNMLKTLRGCFENEMAKNCLPKHIFASLHTDSQYETNLFLKS